MINVSKVLYSRTKYRDYRWILKSNKISFNLLSIMMNDYRHFERQKNFYIEQKYQFIFHFDKTCGAIFYKFYKTDMNDIMGRNIYGLYGIFVDLDLMQLIYGLFPAFALDFILNSANIPDLKNISEESENIEESIEMSIDHIWQNYNNNRYNVLYNSLFGSIKKEYQRNKSFIFESFYFPNIRGFYDKQPDVSDTFVEYSNEKNLISSYKNNKFELEKDYLLNIGTRSNKIIKEIKYNHQLIEDAFIQKKISTRGFCEKCNRMTKVKIVLLNTIDGNPVKYVNFFWGGLRRLMGENELYAFECQECNTKFVVNIESKILDEWK